MSEPVRLHAPRRRRRSLALTLALFALVAVALAAASILILRTIDAERRERAQVERTDQILVALGDIGRSAINAETGQRGYYITLDRRYLAPYQLGSTAYPIALRRLHVLLADSADPEVAALLARIEQLAEARFRELAGSVALIEQGRILDAQQAILSDEGQVLMQELRATLGRLEEIERGRLAAAGAETAALEERLVPLLVGLLTAVVLALALGLWQVARTASAEAQAAHAAELAEARDRADLLARELNHRVKNLFAVILGIVRMTGRSSPEAKPAVDRISERLHALVRAHDVTQGASASAVVDLRHLIDIATAPYCSAEERCEMDGPPVSLPGDMAMPLGLVLHELVTNAVKYGAWSQPGGIIHVHWRRENGQLLLDWREQASAPVAPESTGRGFGSQLIASSARQLGGTIERRYAPEGIAITMRLPLPDPA